MKIPWAKITFPNGDTLSNGIDTIGEYIEAHRVGAITKRKFNVSKAGLLGALMYLSTEPYFLADNPKLYHVLAYGCELTAFSMTLRIEVMSGGERTYVIKDDDGSYITPLTKRGMHVAVTILNTFTQQKDWKHEALDY